MKQLRHEKQFSKKLLQGALFSMLLFISMVTQAQTIPELVFKNPSLISGVGGQDGAVYKFSKVATGLDATLKITRRSSASVVLTDIDDQTTGWTKSLQPTLGLQGTVPAGRTWWMEFELKFLNAGTTDKKQVNSFSVTALDIDGDGRYLQEFVQMDKVANVTNASFSYLVQDIPLSLAALLTDDLSPYNLSGTDKKILGPTRNFGSIDTAATAVMSTFDYTDKDVIKFILGGKTSGGSTTAGMRMYSLWFKSFNLATYSVLPVKLSDFNISQENKNVVLKWTSDLEENFSHYVIERSTDAQHYKDIALVFGSEQPTTVTNYQYKDKEMSAWAGPVYYRLRLTEKTGSYSYSDTKVIRLGNDHTLQLTAFPNPFTGNLRISLPASWNAAMAILEVYNTNGMRVKSFSVNAKLQEELNLKSLQPGLYILKASAGSQVAQESIIKQ